MDGFKPKSECINPMIPNIVCGIKGGQFWGGREGGGGKDARGSAPRADLNSNI